MYPLDFDYVRAEMHGKLANIVAPNEVVITTTLQIEFGPVGGFLHVCIPYSMIEPIRDLLSNPMQDEVEVDKRWVKQMSQQMQSADVELTADFVTIDLDHRRAAASSRSATCCRSSCPTTVTAQVDGVPVMECGYGISNERYALRVQQMISHQDSDPKNDHD